MAWAALQPSGLRVPPSRRAAVIVSTYDARVVVTRGRSGEGGDERLEGELEHGVGAHCLALASTVHLWMSIERANATWVPGRGRWSGSDGMSRRDGPRTFTVPGR